MAKRWSAFEKWKYDVKNDEGELMKPYSGLEQTIDPTRVVDVYVDMDPDAHFDSGPLNSFKKSTLTKMTYEEFLEKSAQTTTSISYVLKDSNLSELLANELDANEGMGITTFIDEFSEPAGLTLIQSSTDFYYPPQYQPLEKFLCSMDGLI